MCQVGTRESARDKCEYDGMSRGALKRAGSVGPPLLRCNHDKTKGRGYVVNGTVSMLTSLYMHTHASCQVDIPCTWRKEQPRRCMHTYACAPRLATNPAPACLGKPELYIFVWKHAIWKTLSRISWLLTEEILQVQIQSRILTSWFTPFPPDFNVGLKGNR